MDSTHPMSRRGQFFRVIGMAGLMLVCLFEGNWAAGNPITLEQLRTLREAAKHRPRNLIYNNDGGDMIDTDDHTPQGLLDVQTSGIAGTQADSLYYVSRSSGFGLFTHNTSVGEIFTSTGGRYYNNMTQDLINQGTDTVKVMNDFAHANNMEFVWSMRMNDTHDASGESYLYAFPQLKVDHPEWLMGTISDPPAYGQWSAIDYGVAEVRSLALAYVQEVCQNYDVDGVELDFCRHPYFFRSHAEGGTATDTDRGLMTQLMRDIRTMTEQVGMERGSPILVSVRIPDSMGICNGVGLDVPQWLQEGLIDTMAVSDYYRAEEWSASVALGHEYDVPVYACLAESRMGGDAGVIRKSYDSYMGRASAAWAEGVDGIYMFNYFDDHSPLWNVAGDQATLSGVNKVYTTGARDVNYMPGAIAGGLSYLNRTVVSPERTMSITRGSYRDIPLTIGDDLSGYSSSEARVKLRLRVADLSSSSDFRVWLNNTLLGGGTLANGYLDYLVPLSLVNQGSNTFRLNNRFSSSGTVTLQDLLVYLSFRPTGFRAPTLEEAFLTGSPADPAKGQYAVGALVNGFSPTVEPFVGNWIQGQGTHPECYQVVSTGLARSDMDTRGGAVRFQSSTAISGKESVLRAFDVSDVTTEDNVFYMAGLMSFDGNFSTSADAIALTGLLNAEEGDPSVSWTIGLQWGFQGDGGGGVDAVVRYRDDGSPNPVVTSVVGDNVTAGTHLFVARVEVDYAGNSSDNVMVWLDPSDTWSEAAASLGFDAACWMLPSDDPNRLVDTLVLSTTNLGANAAVLFDEIRMGKTWGDLFLPLAGLPGDANGDGHVDALDATIVSTHWGTTVTAWTSGDFNGDGAVNALDASILAANWGRSSESGRNDSLNDVPEPSVALMLLLGFAASLWSRPNARTRSVPSAIISPA
ncbi:MAG TPA: dockerin type I domain-containing protein [Thermoguttaceae bacterium]|nr:dockerin type I domain-containing protein [Thermoguttaceae bacterium]